MEKKDDSFFNLISFELYALLLGRVNRLDAVFIITALLLKIVIACRHHSFIVGKSLSDESFFQVLGTGNSPRGLNLPNKVHEEAIQTSSILAIVLTILWVGALSWWNNTFFIAECSHCEFFLVQDNHWKLSLTHPKKTDAIALPADETAFAIFAADSFVLVWCFGCSFIWGMKWWMVRYVPMVHPWLWNGVNILLYCWETARNIQLKHLEQKQGLVLLKCEKTRQQSCI